MSELTCPQGGDAVWGNATFAPDDLLDSDFTHGELVAFRDNVLQAASAEEQLSNMTADSAGAWILARTPKHFQVRSRQRHLFSL